MPSKFGWETRSERSARLQAEADERARVYEAYLRREQARLATEAAAKKMGHVDRMRPIRETAAGAHALIMELLADYANCSGLKSSPARSDLGDTIRWSLPLGHEQGTVYITAGPGELVVSPSYPNASASAAEIAEALNRFTHHHVALHQGGTTSSNKRYLPKA
jgi:hypothetical protein